MYKGTHDYLQGRANGHNPFEFASGDEVMTESQRRDALKTKLRSIEKRLAELPANHVSRKHLGREKAVVQEQLSALREVDDKNGVERFFVQAAKEILSQGQFNLVMAEAVKLLKRFKEIEYGVKTHSIAEMPKPMKQDMEQAVKDFIAKGGSITKVKAPSDMRAMMNVDPRVAALTEAQRKIYRKLKSCGVCKEDALREAQKP